MSTEVYDIAVVGSGFAGSLLAMIAHRLGRSVILLEKGRHPRFAIGESSTPLTNLLLEELTTRYNLPALTPLAKWGTWQEAYPDLACGLKRGFTFYHHTLGEPPVVDFDRANQLLVAASPHDGMSDTHWYRADFDHHFVRVAQSIGVEYVDEIALTGASESDNEVRIDGVKSGRQVTIRARFVVDASGPRGFLYKALHLPEATMPGLPHTQALYTHFSNVGGVGDIEADPSGEPPPYPVDHAAVHHVFTGGWIWVLQFNNGITSAGIAATNELAQRLRLTDGAEAWQRLLTLIPKVQRQFARANIERPFTHVPRLSFRSGAVSGKHWALLPSAAGFVDPLLSTGFTLTLLGVARLAEVIEEHWASEAFRVKVGEVAGQNDKELLATGRLIGSLYASMTRFPLFVALSFLYFVPAIFSETARRLGKPHLAPSFLLFDDATFGPRCLDLFDRVQKGLCSLECVQLQAEIVRAIEPLNVAGLGDPRRKNWYPVDAADLYAGAWKLGATHREISTMLQRVGFLQ